MENTFYYEFRIRIHTNANNLPHSYIIILPLMISFCSLYVPIQDRSVTRFIHIVFSVFFSFTLFLSLGLCLSLSHSHYFTFTVGIMSSVLIPSLFFYVYFSLSFRQEQEKQTETEQNVGGGEHDAKQNKYTRKRKTRRKICAQNEFQDFDLTYGHEEAHFQILNVQKHFNIFFCLLCYGYASTHFHRAFFPLFSIRNSKISIGNLVLFTITIWVCYLCCCCYCCFGSLLFVPLCIFFTILIVFFFVPSVFRQKTKTIICAQ